MDNSAQLSEKQSKELVAEVHGNRIQKSETKTTRPCVHIERSQTLPLTIRPNQNRLSPPIHIHLGPEWALKQTTNRLLVGHE